MGQTSMSGSHQGRLPVAVEEQVKWINRGFFYARGTPGRKYVLGLPRPGRCLALAGVRQVLVWGQGKLRAFLNIRPIKHFLCLSAARVSGWESFLWEDAKTKQTKTNGTGERPKNHKGCLDFVHRVTHKTHTDLKGPLAKGWSR